MVTPVRRVSDPAAAANPNTVKVVFDRAGRALYFSRSPLPFWRDGGQPYFYRHIGIYAYRVQFLKEFVHLPPGRWEEAEKLEQLRALEHGFPIHVVETTGDTREVDSPEDLRQVEEFLRELISKADDRCRRSSLHQLNAGRHQCEVRIARKPTSKT